MRGTHSDALLNSVARRIIPAHAGNSVRQAVDETPEPDHPRACGELETTPESATT